MKLCRWETSITEQCIWTTMLKIINEWKNYGPVSSQVSLAVPRTAHLNGRQNSCPSQCIDSFFLYNPHPPPVSHVGSKKPIRHSSLTPAPRLFQTIAGISPRTFLLVSYQQSTTGDWGWESEEWPRVFISSHLPTDLWSTAVLYFKALTVSYQCRNIPQLCNNPSTVFKQSIWKNQQNIFGLLYYYLIITK